ncbi:MAG: hypothetical protein HW383_371 [Candidatus Magasanikbacteria bacterium]|nr:hypothetical protein [Candidatus Magasanikbacteria bacterium]
MKKKYVTFGIALIIFASVFVSGTARAAVYDVGLGVSDVWIASNNPLVVNIPVLIYATVHNYGENFIGTVYFTDDGEIIETARPISVRTNGVQEEIWVEWTPTRPGLHAIQVKIISSTETPDVDESNNSVVISRNVLADADNDGIPDVDDPDADGDGMPNIWEEKYGFNPLDPSDAVKDPDADGASNLSEYLRGTNPLVSDLPPNPPSGGGGGGGSSGGGSSGGGGGMSGGGASGGAGSGPSSNSSSGTGTDTTGSTDTAGSKTKSIAAIEPSEKATSNLIVPSSPIVNFTSAVLAASESPVIFTVPLSEQTVTSSAAEIKNDSDSEKDDHKSDGNKISRDFILTLVGASAVAALLAGAGASFYKHRRETKKPKE